MLTFSIESVRQLQQDWQNGKRPNVQLTPEQRRTIENFRPTREEINQAYAKARQKVEKDEKL